MEISKEDKFTSTGSKFWYHKPQMEEYRRGGIKTVISTHISPEGSCNLRCEYCSVSNRKTFNRIDIDIIKKYITDLEKRGLRAVILTGGGEPTIYPQFNELIQWIVYERKLKVALITNGCFLEKIEKRTLKAFTWIRISINFFNGWEEKISMPRHISDECVVGASFIYTEQGYEILNDVKKVADKIRAKYVRILPDCTSVQKELIEKHEIIKGLLNRFKDERFFQQFKYHDVPKASICHQSFFRPYLSEETYEDTDIPGSVYPCDSVVLNNDGKRFIKEYQICSANDVLDFIDGRIKMKFNPKERCEGCVFTKNINMLDDWKNEGRGIGKFSKLKTGIIHKEFV